MLLHAAALLLPLLAHVLQAFPSPDDEIAAEIEHEIAAAGRMDYGGEAEEGPGQDYSSTDDVDAELMNILGGKTAGAAAPGYSNSVSGSMPNIPGLTKGPDGQLYYHGERVKSISALDSADEVKKMSELNRLDEMTRVDPLSSVQELKSLQEVLRKEPVLRMQEVKRIRPISKIHEVVRKTPVVKMEEVSRITPVTKLSEISHMEEVISKQEVEDAVARAFIQKHFPYGAPSNPFGPGSGSGNAYPLAIAPPAAPLLAPAPAPAAPQQAPAPAMAAPAFSGDEAAPPKIFVDPVPTTHAPAIPAPTQSYPISYPSPSEKNVGDLSRAVELEDKKIEVLKKHLVKLIGEVRRIEEVISKHEIIKLEKVQKIREIKTMQEIKRMEEVRKIEEVKTLDEVLSMQEVLSQELVKSIQPVTKIQEIANVYPLTESQVAELKTMMSAAGKKL